MSGVHHCRLAVIVVIEVLIYELILETQRLHHFLNVLGKEIISLFHGRDELSGGHNDGTDVHFPN